jgi:Zn-dependent protease with chaperone function
VTSVATYAAPEAASSIDGEAIYFDGQSAKRRIVRLRLRDQLDIVEEGRVLDIWPYADIRRTDGATGELRLRSVAARELARLEITDKAFAGALAARCPLLDQASRTGGGLGAIIFWSLAAACSIVLMAVYGVPLAADRIAPLVPPYFEQRLGDAAANQVKLVLGKATCAKPDGAAALHKLVGELTAQSALPMPIDAQVLDSKVANAFALPGGRVFVLRGLLDKADNVDELAGVVAHELGHVAHRDTLREMISSGGAAFLFGLLLGDVSGSGAVIFAGRALLTSAYSRDAEARADAYAAVIMRGLGRSPAPMGEFLLRLTGKQQGGAIALFNSHPLTQDRLAALKAGDQPVSGQPLLSDEEWRALKGICS